MRHHAHRRTSLVAGLTAMLFLLFAAPYAALAQQEPAEGTRGAAETAPFRPTLQVNIPTVDFSTHTVTEDGTTRTIDVPWLAQYIEGAYRYAVAAAGVVAAAMIMLGGVQYLTAGGNTSRVGAAKERIANAVVGLLLVAGSYLILNTVNPELVEFDTLQVKTVQREVFTAEEIVDYGDNAGTDGGPSPRAICRTVESCKEICDRGRENWPTTAPGILDPSDAEPIPNIPGLEGNGRTASANVIAGLQRAAGFAHAEGLTIKVTSGYRPLRTQIALVCNRMGNPASESGIGTAVAWPGGSNHGAGYAVDIQLWRGGTKLVSSGGCNSQGNDSHATLENSQLFDRIMTRAGAKRYAKEVWHYEFGGSASCRCQHPNCPSPLRTCAQMPCS